MATLPNIAKAGALAIVTAAVMAAAPAASAKDASGRTSCFFSTEWRGWSSPSPNVIYLDVGRHRIYRVDVVGGSSHMNTGGNYLVSQIRGSNSICSHLDLDLAVADTNGFRMPLIAERLTLLTPEEVAAIPRKDLP